MKLTLLFLLISICSFGQSVNRYKDVADQNKKDTPTFKFDALNSAIVKERDLALINFKKADSAVRVTATRMLQVNGINLMDVSDSTRVTPEGIYLKLKPKKK